MRPSFTASLRRAVRSLARRPLFTALAVSTVAIGIAASTAAFVLVRAAFLAPIPFSEPERLVTVDVTSAQGFDVSMSVPNYRDWSGRTRVFESTGGIAEWGVVLSGHGPARTLHVARVLGDVFGTLGLEPVRGRAFTAGETDRGAVPTVVISHALWRELGADPELLGSALILDDVPFTVIGVLPPGAGFPSAGIAAYLPLGARGERLPWETRESSFGMRMLAKLRPGTSIATAQADVERVNSDLRRELGRAIATARVRSLTDYLVGPLEAPLALLAAAAALLVALTVVNGIGLFLARGESRRGELAVRAALGAPASDRIRLQLAEAAPVVAAGWLAGVAGAHAILVALAAAVPEQVPGFVLARLRLDAVAVGFALLTAAVVLALVTVLPAWRRPAAGGLDLLQGARSGGSRRSLRVGSALVVGQLALGVVLLVGASLLVSSLGRLETVDKGFDERGVVSAVIVPPARHFEDRASWLGFHERVLAGARSLPGVENAALSLLVPLSDRSWEMNLFPRGEPIEPGEGSSALFNVVSPEYFDTLGLSLVRGRGFTSADRNGTEPVVIVDRTLAERFWPGEEPLGRQVAIGFDFDVHEPATAVYRTVVGVVENLRHYELRSPSRIQVFLPYEQLGERFDMSLTLLAKTSGDPAPLVRELPRLVAGIDPAVPLVGPTPLAANVDRALVLPRLLGGTLTLLCAFALGLAGIGAFALASFGVASRSRELCLRQALGATPPGILALVFGRGLRWVALALALGLPLAAVGARLARSLLFGVGALDPASFLGSAAALSGVVLLACLAPALRAVRTEPARLLREDA